LNYFIYESYDILEEKFNTHTHTRARARARGVCVCVWRNSIYLQNDSFVKQTLHIARNDKHNFDRG